MLAMIDFMMAMTTGYCLECMKNGKFYPLKFVMMNISSGMWMCPKTDCIFPMNCNAMQNYTEDNMTTEKVLRLTSRKYTSSSNKMNHNNAKTSMEPFYETLKTNNRFLNPSTPKTSTLSNSSSGKPSSVSPFSHSSSEFYPENIQTLSSSLSEHLIKFPLWENEGLLCWLDSALSMVMLNTSVRAYFTDRQQASECLLNHITQEYEKLLMNFQVHKCYENIRKQLNDIRSSVLTYLQPKLLVNYGKEDSPLFSLPLLLKTDSKLYEKLEVQYKCTFKCDYCSFVKTDRFRKMIITLPNALNDINFLHNIYLTRPCYRCSAPAQKSKFVINKLPMVLFVHFPEGVATSRCWEDFTFLSNDGEKYIVTQMIQYLKRKRHFVLWSYNHQEKLWLKADDLLHPVVQYKYSDPICHPSEVHIVAWESIKTLDAAHQTVAKGTAHRCDLTMSLNNDARRLERYSHASLSPSADELANSSSCGTPSGVTAKSNLFSKGMSVADISRYQPYISKRAKLKQQSRETKSIAVEQTAAATSPLSTTSNIPRDTNTDNNPQTLVAEPCIIPDIGSSSQNLGVLTNTNIMTSRVESFLYAENEIDDLLMNSSSLNNINFTDHTLTSSQFMHSHTPAFDAVNLNALEDLDLETLLK